MTGINISGKWLIWAGFTTGQPLKLRFMSGCLTVQYICELWRCVEGPRLQAFDQRTAAEWLRRFPGGRDMTWITGSD